MRMKYLIFPGQGSQKPGFMNPWIEDERFRTIVERHSEITGLDLIKLGTEANQQEISQTGITQPLIVSASIASARTVFTESEISSFDGMAGHSVGEFAAAALSGVISDEQAMKLVALRAKAMQKTANEIDTGMAAAIGANLEQLEAKLGNLVIANYNGANQYVLAGAKTDLELIKEDPPAGFRIIPLAVTGAFHTEYMEPAKEALEEHFLSVKPENPKQKLFSNKDGQAMTSGEDYVRSLLSQVSSPVRWDKCMEMMSDATVVVEAAPSGVLSNLLKKTLDDLRMYSLKSPTDSIELGTND